MLKDICEGDALYHRESMGSTVQTCKTMKLPSLCLKWTPALKELDRDSLSLHKPARSQDKLPQERA